MLTDDKLVELSNTIDTFLVTSLAKDDLLHPLDLSAVMIARLMWLSKNAQCVKDFHSILDAAKTMNMQEGDNATVYKH